MTKIIPQYMGYLNRLNPLKKDQREIPLVIQKIKSGDKTQLEAIYKANKFAFISWITRQFRCSEDDANDVYQFAILTFYENIQSGKLTELNSSVKTYLFAIGKNKILEQKKAATKFSVKNNNEIERVPELENWDSDLKEASLELVEICLEKLGEPCKSLLQLYYYHGMSMDEITEKMRYKNRYTTKNLKYKCINRLRKIYLEELRIRKRKNYEEQIRPY